MAEFVMGTRSRRIGSDGEVISLIPAAIKGSRREQFFAPLQLAGMISAVLNVTGPSRPDSSNGESFV